MEARQRNRRCLRAFVISASFALSYSAWAQSSGPAAAGEFQCSTDDSGLRLPPGFCATLFADDIGHARHLAIAPNGVVYVNTWSGRYYGREKTREDAFIVALQDTKGAGKADVRQRFGETVQSGGAGGTGIAIHGDALFVEINDRIEREQARAGLSAFRALCRAGWNHRFMAWALLSLFQRSSSGSPGKAAIDRSTCFLPMAAFFWFFGNPVWRSHRNDNHRAMGLIMDTSQIFDFEMDFAGTLRCIPMVVRFKLDQCGVKLSLRQWSRFSRDERTELVQRDCSTAENVRSYAEYLCGLIESKAADKPVRLDPVSAAQWEEAGAVPVRLVVYARQLGLAPPSLQQWRALTPLRRFALFKLTRPGHDNDNFVPAMREFGLAH